MIKLSRVYLTCTSKCGASSASHNDEASHCWRCGEPLEKWVKTCVKCLIEFGEVGEFCDHCGTKLVSTKLAWKGTNEQGQAGKSS